MVNHLTLILMEQSIVQTNSGDHGSNRGASNEPSALEKIIIFRGSLLQMERFVRIGYRSCPQGFSSIAGPDLGALLNS